METPAAEMLRMDATAAVLDALTAKLRLIANGVYPPQVVDQTSARCLVDVLESAADTRAALLAARVDADTARVALRDVMYEYEELRDAEADYAREMAVEALGIALQELQTALAATPGEATATQEEM